MRLWKKLLKSIMVFLGFFFGIINSLPIPWRLRLMWGKFIYLIMDMSSKWMPFFTDYLQKADIDYKRGEPQENRDKAAHDFKNLIQSLELNLIPIEKIADALKMLDEKNVRLDDYGKHLFDELLREK